MDFTADDQIPCCSKSLRRPEQVHIDNYFKNISDDLVTLSSNSNQEEKWDPEQGFNSDFDCVLLSSLHSGNQPSSTESAESNLEDILDQQGSYSNILNGTYVSIGPFESDPILSDILLSDPLLDACAFGPANPEPESLATNMTFHYEAVPDSSSHTQQGCGTNQTVHDDGSMPESDQPFIPQNAYSTSGIFSCIFESHAARTRPFQQNYENITNAGRATELKNDDELCYGKEMLIWLLDCIRWLNIEAARSPCKDYFRPSLIALEDVFNIVIKTNYEFFKQLPRTAHQKHHHFYCRLQPVPTYQEVDSTTPDNNGD